MLSHRIKTPLNETIKIDFCIVKFEIDHDAEKNIDQIGWRRSYSQFNWPDANYAILN